jgi:quercetin dioxygenase-like cupin family protein
MATTSLHALSEAGLRKAHNSSARRSATAVYTGPDRRLRQTLIALAAGGSLADHDSPGEATVHVLVGHVRLTAGTLHWEGRTGDLLPIPPARHSLAALSDAVILLTVTPTPTEPADAS